MNLSDARKAKIPRKKKFPVGRGHSSGLGEWCGRGNKGQYSRQGTSFRHYFEGGQMPIIRRLPKRGFNNAEFRTDYEGVNVGDLNERFADGATVDEASLREKKLIRRHEPIKILGDGPLAKKLTVKAHKFSKAAEEKITKAGGSVVRIGEPADAAESKKGDSGKAPGGKPGKQGQPESPRAAKKESPKKEPPKP